MKPKYKCRNVPCLNFIGDTGICNISEKRCNPYECQNEYKPDTTHKFWKEGEAYYPDFENPENFVKLLELEISSKTTFGTLWGYFCDKNKSLSLDRKQFLQMLRIYLKKEKFHFQAQTIVHSRIKQSIRDYDGWVWR